MSASLNNETIRQLKTVLEKCVVLQSKDNVRLLFRDRRVTIWHDLISDTTSLSERIASLIVNLLDEADEKGQNALVLFLLVVAEHERTTRQKRQLQELARLVAKDLDLPDPLALEWSKPVDSHLRGNDEGIAKEERLPKQVEGVDSRLHRNGEGMVKIVAPKLSWVEWGQQAWAFFQRWWQAGPSIVRWLPVGVAVGLILLWFAPKLSDWVSSWPTPIPTQEVAQATATSPPPLAVTNTLTRTLTHTPKPSATSSLTHAPTLTNTQTLTVEMGAMQVSDKDGMVQMYVSAGTFLRGSSSGSSNETPQREITLDAFWIDQYEVNNNQYAQFLNERGDHLNCEGEPCTSIDNNTYIYLQEGVYKVKDNFADHPTIMVSWYGADAYCEWAGRRLPTEAEWEKAARGTDGRSYPWGNEFDGHLHNFCDAQCELDWADKSVDDGYPFTAPVGSYPAGASPYGVMDMFGNVWEWVNDWFNSDYYEFSPDQNPQGPGFGDYRVLRGGSWDNLGSVMRASDRSSGNPTDRYYNVGFRCAQEGFSP